MGLMLIRLSDDVERRFREAAIRVFGAKKGSLSRAVEEAIKMWLKTVESEQNVRKDWEDLRIEVPNKNLTRKILNESRKTDKVKIYKLLKALGLEEKE
nr:hypothetical protein [Candidatus Baldrarchaeota archaeon]